MRVEKKRRLVIPMVLAVATIAAAGIAASCGEDKPECICELPRDYDGGAVAGDGLLVPDGGCGAPLVPMCTLT